MCKRPMQLRGEKKMWIDRRHLPRPQPPQFRAYVSVKRSVDFDDVEKPRQKFDRLNFLSRHFGWIENPVPFFIRPAGSPNADSRIRFHTRGPRAEVSNALSRSHRSCASPL